MAVLSRDVVIPLADYPSGSREFTINNIDDTAVGFTLELLRCTTATPTVWPNAATGLQILIDASLDNGKTWIGCGGVGSVGGIHVRRDGTESPMTTFSCAFPPGNRRRVRIAVEITNGPLRTSGTLELRNE